MSSRELRFEEIRAFCASREVDLAVSPPPHSSVLCLRAQFDRQGHFFSILARDPEYIEVCGEVTVGDLMMVNDINAVSQLSAKWGWLKGEYSGLGVVIRRADADRWENARPNDLFVIIANHIAFMAGDDWGRPDSP